MKKLAENSTENRQSYIFSSTRNSVSKLCRADLQYLGLKTPLKAVNFQLFCWVLLLKYSKKFDFPESCLVNLVDIGNCKVKPSIRVQHFASPIVNLLSLFKIFDLKSKVDCTSYKLNKKGNVSLRDGKK